jgi:hypothetical protein
LYHIISYNHTHCVLSLRTSSDTNAHSLRHSSTFAQCFRKYNMPFIVVLESSGMLYGIWSETKNRAQPTGSRCRFRYQPNADYIILGCGSTIFFLFSTALFAHLQSTVWQLSCHSLFVTGLLRITTLSSRLSGAGFVHLHRTKYRRLFAGWPTPRKGKLTDVLHMACLICWRHQDDFFFRFCTGGLSSCMV